MAGTEAGQIFWQEPYCTGVFLWAAAVLVVLGAYEQKNVRHGPKRRGRTELVARTAARDGAQCER